MTSKINVLIFPAGEINSVELHDALATSVNIRLYGASSVERHGKYIFENYISGLPLISEDNFFTEFNQVLQEFKIDVIFPTHDTIAAFLSDNHHRAGAKLITGDARTSYVCRSKMKTYDVFEKFDFIPEVYKDRDAVNSFPVFAKPDKGQGSLGAKCINSKDELRLIDLNNYVITEYLPGNELTIDCVTDKYGELRYISPRSRDRVMAGVSVAGKTQLLTDEIESIAREINEELKFLGLWFFQLKQDITGRYKLLEISTRCAGSMCLTRAKGVNLPLLSVYIAMGYDVDVFANSFPVVMDRTLISRYSIDYEYDKVYIDLDDTLIINNQINLNAIRFLYQCINKKKHLCLLTKHDKELGATLLKYSISRNLFEEIIHLKPEENKSDHIIPEGAIFIDNAFQERKIIHDKFGIPVFDVDGIEVLLDWRV